MLKFNELTPKVQFFVVLEYYENILITHPDIELVQCWDLCESDDFTRYAIDGQIIEQ